MGKVVLSLLLETSRSRDDTIVEIHKYLTDMNTKIRSGFVPMRQFLITKGTSDKCFPPFFSQEVR
jgi:hypothetical protein